MSLSKLVQTVTLCHWENFLKLLFLYEPLVKMWKSLTKLFPVRSLCKSHSEYWGKRSKKCWCHIIKSNVFAITDKNFSCWLSKTFSTRPIRIVHFLHFQFTVVSPEFRWGNKTSSPHAHFKKFRPPKMAGFF